MTKKTIFCTKPHCQELATHELKWDNGCVYVCDKHLPDNHLLLRNFSKIEKSEEL